jgi:PHP family Zn ribbon phosphoesterase
MRNEKRHDTMYRILDGGYVRVNSEQDYFLYNVLSNEKNRTWLHRIKEYTVCKLLMHLLDETIVVERGYHNKLGTFKVGLCERCRRKVVAKHIR